MDRFPKDCWDKKCKHFKVWDMSIDDLCCRCELLKKECDACDEDFSYVRCPKEETDYSREDFSTTKLVLNALYGKNAVDGLYDILVKSKYEEQFKEVLKAWPEEIKKILFQDIYGVSFDEKKTIAEYNDHNEHILERKIKMEKYFHEAIETIERRIAKLEQSRDELRCSFTNVAHELTALTDLLEALKKADEEFDIKSLDEIFKS